MRLSLRLLLPLFALATSAGLQGEFTYVDAAFATNTGPAHAFAGAVTQPDNLWGERNHGTDGTVLESSGTGSGSEDSPEISTTIDGLVPGRSYYILVHFYDVGVSSGENWPIRAGFTSGDLTLFANNADGGFLEGATAAVPASRFAYATAPRFDDGENRLLYAARLGSTEADANGRIAVFIDDLPSAVGANNRTWYDGVSYIPLPLAPDGDPDNDGLMNADEETHGTDPFVADTDGDGFSDGDEVAQNSDPLDPNSVPPPPPLPGNAIEIAPDGAWTWFNDERAIFHRGFLYSGYVKGDGQYGVTRYDPATDTRHHMIISTAVSRQQDDHNNPSITALPDGRLLVCYAKHLGGNTFWYRKSLNATPATDADWGPEQAQTVPANNTYNNTYRLSAESDRLYNFQRSTNYNPTVTISDDHANSWQPTVHLIRTGEGGTRPYTRFASNHKDRIDLIYTDAHPRNGNNSMYHLYYRDGRFHQTDGTVIRAFDDLPIEHDRGERGSTVYSYSDDAWGPDDGPDAWIPAGRAWTWDVHYGPDGHPVCVFQVQRDNVTGTGWNHDRIYYYYARWTGTEWKKRFVAQAGRGLYSSEDDYGGGMAIDPENPNVIYISSNAARPFDLSDIAEVPLAENERYELYRGVTRDGGGTFAWEQLTVDSPEDNIRPIVPENHGFDRAVIWFYGTYRSYTSFDTRVLAILENDLVIKAQTLSPATHEGELAWASSPGRNYRLQASSDLLGFTEFGERIPSAGSLTQTRFDFPLSLRNASRGFFRVRESTEAP